MTEPPHETSQPVVYADPRLMDPSGSEQRWMLEEEMIPTDKDGLPVPMLRTGHVAMIFFGRKPSWMYFLFSPRKFTGRTAGGREIREKLDSSWFILDGEEMQFRRDKHGRYYSLADVERMTHALAQHAKIDGATAQRALLMIKTCAQQTGILS